MFDLRTGIDLCEIQRMEQLLCKASFMHRWLTEAEEAWVISIAKKSISRYYGVIAKLKGRISDSLSRLPDKKLLEEIPAEVDVEMLVADRALCEDIFDTVSSMPSDVQRIVYMYYILDMSAAETAKALRMSEGAVKSRLYRALDRIRRSYRISGKGGETL